MKKTLFFSLILLLTTSVATADVHTLQDFRKKVFKFSNIAPGNSTLKT